MNQTSNLSKKKMNKNIEHGAILSYFMIGITLMLSIMYTPWMLNKIGRSDYGLYTLAMSVINFFLLDFGISNGIARFISIFRAKNQEEKISELISIVLKIYLVGSLILLCILSIIYLFINNIFIKLTFDEINKFKTIYTIIGIYGVVSFPLMPLNGMYIAYEKFLNLKIFEFTSKLLSTLMIVIFLLHGKGLFSIVLINVCVNILILILKILYLKKNTNIKINFQLKNKELLKQLFKFSIWITFIALFQRLIINLSPTILARFSGTIEISLFSIGVALEGYTWTISNALNGLFLPKVAKITEINNDKFYILELMTKVGRIQLIIMLLITMGFIFFGKEFLIIWIGKEFEKAYYVVILLIMPNLVTSTQEIGINYLTIINKVKWQAFDYFIIVLISLSGSIILTPKYGAVGIAISIFLGSIIGHIIFMNLIYSKKLKINILNFFKECHFKILPVIIILIPIGNILSKMIIFRNFYDLLMKILIFLIIYIILIWKIFLNVNEKKNIKRILNLQNKKLKEEGA